MTDYQSIFNRDFYPTPREVIERMLIDEDIANKVILEPSAGSGNIVKFLYEFGCKEVLACEINDNLRSMLGGMCNVIGSDFLKLKEEEISHIDAIVMNPPFSQGMKHILHAYNIAPEGCTIISLINSDNLRRRYRDTEEAELQEKIELFGHEEFIGNVFKDAERETNVNVSIIKLYKPKTGAHEFDDFEFDHSEDDEISGKGIMPYNAVRDLVQRYKEAVSKFNLAMSVASEINELTKITTTRKDYEGKDTEYIWRSSIQFGAFQKEGDKCKTEISRDFFKKQLQKEMWRFIFNKLDMQKYATSELIKEINRFVEKSECMPFTMRNIYRVLSMVVQTHGTRMERAIAEAFDIICSFSAENSSAGEKWKTNANYMVNRRFIVPYITETSWRDEGFVEVGYDGNATKIDDINKALCHVTCKAVPEGYQYSFRNELREMKLPWGKWGEWGFFRVRGYKKGTMHFEFLDENVWYKFNQIAAKQKGWSLPKKPEPKKKATQETKPNQSPPKSDTLSMF